MCQWVYSFKTPLLIKLKIFSSIYGGLFATLSLFEWTVSHICCTHVACSTFRSFQRSHENKGWDWKSLRNNPNKSRKRYLEAIFLVRFWTDEIRHLDQIRLELYTNRLRARERERREKWSAKHMIIFRFISISKYYAKSVCAFTFSLKGCFWGTTVGKETAKKVGWNQIICFPFWGT